MRKELRQWGPKSVLFFSCTGSVARLNKISVLSGFIISDNPKQSSRVPVFIKVLDVNDNAPEFAMFYETFVCENAKAEQVCCVLVLSKYSKWIEFFYYSCITSSGDILCIASNCQFCKIKLNSGCTVPDYA